MMPFGDSLWRRGALLAVAVLLLIMFSSFTATTVLLLILGILLVVFSMATGSRHVGLLAVVLLGLEGSLSLSTESVLEVRMLLSAVLGIFLPLFMIGTILLDPDAELGKAKLSGKRHLYLTLSVISISILSLPIAAFILMVLSLATLIQISTLFEISILLLATVISGSLASMIKPRKRAARGRIE